MTPLDICNTALKHIGWGNLYPLVTQTEEHKMNEGENLTVTKLENGFIVSHNGRSYTADDLDSVKGIASRVYGLVHNGVDMASGPDRTVMVRRSPSTFTRTMNEDSEPTKDQMRDELGELRRFKSEAIRRGNEQNDTIKKLTDMCANYREETMVQEERADDLYKQLQTLIQKQAKKSARRKKA